MKNLSRFSFEPSGARWAGSLDDWGEYVLIVEAGDGRGRR